MATTVRHTADELAERAKRHDERRPAGPDVAQFHGFEAFRGPI